MTQALKQVHFSISTVVPVDEVDDALAGIANDVSDAVKYGVVKAMMVVENAPEWAKADVPGQLDLDELALGLGA